MPDTERRFAGVHLSGYLREHGYPDARIAEGRAAVVPVGAALGAANDAILLELAQRDIEVVRPTPDSVEAIDAADEVAFVGVRGQLDPFRGLHGGAHARALASLGALLVRRRLRRSPVVWHARTTSRSRQRGAPGELATLALLGLLARRAGSRASGEAPA
jgi:hypothetical protein